MKKFALIAAMLVTPVLADDSVVELNKTVQCAKTDFVFDTLRNKYHEFPIWGGAKENSHYVLTVNPSTSTWSLVNFNDEVACLIDAGVGFRINTVPKNNTSPEPRKKGV